MIDPEILFPDTPFPLAPSLVLLARRGSEAHGTYIPSTDPGSIDDRDLMGICIPPPRWTIGLHSWEGADAIKGPWDVVLYDYRKFVRLLLKQNANVLSLLWLEPEDYLHVSPAGAALIEHRHLFRSKDAAHAFIGYAQGQRHKMKNGAFMGYMGDKRKKLVERYGYDTKNAAHCVRLLRMGTEYLTTGTLQVRRTHDVDQLLAIKRGEYTLDAVQALIDALLVLAREAERRTVLPDTIDLEAVENLVLQAMVRALAVEPAA